MAQGLIKGYLDYSPLAPENIFISGRKPQKTKKVSGKFGVQMAPDNEELLEKSSVVFLCVKPGDGEAAIQSMGNSLTRGHTLISVLAGISLGQLRGWGLSSRRLARLMPNMAVQAGQGFLPFYSYQNRESLNAFLEEILQPLGKVMALEREDLLSSLTVASASGAGFLLELMEYWLEWLQGQGFSYQQAREISCQVFLGSGLLAKTFPQKKLADLREEISSPKGVTVAGLKAMRELELERILRLGFEEASLRERQISLLQEAPPKKPYISGFLARDYALPELAKAGRRRSPRRPEPKKRRRNGKPKK